MDECFIRIADINDVDLLYEWVNDIDVRENSFYTEKVEYDAHVKWFKGKLSDEDTIIYIYYHNGIPTGQIRLSLDRDVALINYSVERKYRGMDIIF